jgi:hypothetical protein
LAEARGDHVGASDHLRPAVDGWRALGHALEEAFTLVDLARNLRLSGAPDARSVTDEARAACHKLALRPLLPVD